eukprot:TRINITY_DN9696_c0_g1_i19.p1 TRINITY_DN9696_c0_g1~~TRINITY_DN9696_c0_g1_i19.p1  ORF type:complete len:194 (+),score=11.28 TRINITY_DN9696_c0_g1_i19:73-654(+)
MCIRDRYYTLALLASLSLIDLLMVVILFLHSCQFLRSTRRTQWRFFEDVLSSLLDVLQQLLSSSLKLFTTKFSVLLSRALSIFVYSLFLFLQSCCIAEFWSFQSLRRHFVFWCRGDVLGRKCQESVPCNSPSDLPDSSELTLESGRLVLRGANTFLKRFIACGLEEVVLVDIGQHVLKPVSYTHLTLPTICSV